MHFQFKSSRLVSRCLYNTALTTNCNFTHTVMMNGTIMFTGRGYQVCKCKKTQVNWRMRNFSFEREKTIRVFCIEMLNYCTFLGEMPLNLFKMNIIASGGQTTEILEAIKMCSNTHPWSFKSLFQMSKEKSFLLFKC